MWGHGMLWAAFQIPESGSGAPDVTYASFIP